MRSTGADTLARFAEAARQAAVADALVISKTDLAPFGDALRARLDALNPGAERIVGAAASDPAAVLFGGSKPRPQPSPASGGGVDMPRRSPSPAAGEGTRWRRAVGAVAAAARGAHPRHRDLHGHPRRPGQPARFRARARRAGAGPRQRPAAGQGLVRFADRPDRPAVVQAAQHAMFTPEWLDAWPDADRRSRLVFIVHDIAPDEILARFAFAAPRSRTAGLRPACGETTAVHTIDKGRLHMLDIVISGGLAVLPSGAEPADIGVQGEKIAAIGAPGSLAALGAGRAIDAAGQIVIPGGIDPHVHCNWPMPVPGRRSQADRAGLAGQPGRRCSAAPRRRSTSRRSRAA